MTLYGVISVKLKQQWYLGEARKFSSVLFVVGTLTWCDMQYLPCWLASFLAQYQPSF